MTLDVGGPLLLLGAGKMGGAMLNGWLALGLDPARVAVLDPSAGPDIQATGVALNPDRAELGRVPVVVLAVKPQMMATALPTITGSIQPGTLVISVMAGKTIQDIAAMLPDGAVVVRAMPNTPAAVGRGITVAVAAPGVNEEKRAIADALLRATGAVEWVEDEGLIDAVTAVSGSGPAYVFYLVEALAAAAEGAGLPPRLAATLARATVSGSGELLHRSDLAPAILRQNVTSPGGTTAAALQVLMAEDGLIPLMGRAVAAAKRRAGELAG